MDDCDRAHLQILRWQLWSFEKKIVEEDNHFLLHSHNENSTRVPALGGKPTNRNTKFALSVPNSFRGKQFDIWTVWSEIFFFEGILV